MSEKVIVALDVDSREAALEVVALLGDSATFYKIGLQLLTASGNPYDRWQGSDGTGALKP